MQDSDHLLCRWLLERPEGELQPYRRINWRGGTVEAITPERPASGREMLVLPALANAHDHCRGVANISFGAADQPLELWLAAMYNAPTVDAYLMAAVAYARLAMGGFGATVHFHVPQDPARMLSEAQASAKAAQDVGLRVAFCVPMRDRFRLAYGPDEEVLAHFAADEREDIRRRFDRPTLPPRDQIGLVEEVATAIESDLIKVHFSPTGIQWCSDALLEAIAEASARTGRMVQMHLLETRRQREFVDATYREGVIRYLDRIGLLSERLVLAHGVHLRPDEIELLAERRVRIAVNTSSNLRLRSGFAPLPAFLRAGVNVGLGIDNMAMDDDDDGFRELRLAYLIHGTHADPRAPLTWTDVLNAAIRGGMQIVRGQEDVGQVRPGQPADFVAIDYGRLAADAVPEAADPLHLALGRASRAFVDQVVVNGRQIVRDGKPTGIDLEAAARELAAQARRSREKIMSERPALERFRKAVASFYNAGGHSRTR